MTRDQLRRVIDEVAREGVVRGSDLTARGVESDDIKAARKRGDLTRVLQGIFVVGGEAPEGDLLARVALAYAGDGACLTGLWAAMLLGWKWIPTTHTIMVLVDAERRRRGSAFWVKVRRCARLPRIPETRVRGLPVADAAQIVVDACRQVKTLRDARGIVLGAVADGHCTVEQIRAVMGQGQAAGTALCRRACIDAERGATSPPEAEFCDAVIGQGRPFYLNPEV